MNRMLRPSILTTVPSLRTISLPREVRVHVLRSRFVHLFLLFPDCCRTHDPQHGLHLCAHSSQGRMLKKDDDDTKDSDDTDESNDKEKKDRKSSGDGDDDPSETRAHRDGRDRGSFCHDIYIVDEDHHCADDVKDAVRDHYEDSSIHMDGDCDEADDNEDLCLEISDGDDCDEIVDDSLDELDEWCTRTEKSGEGCGDENKIIVVTA